MAKINLPKQLAQDYAWNDFDEAYEYTPEYNEQVDSDRWSSYHRLVIKDAEGKYWATSYSKGLTENQYEKPFEYEDMYVEFNEVEKVPAITYEYRTVK